MSAELDASVWHCVGVEDGGSYGLRSGRREEEPEELTWSWKPLWLDGTGLLIATEDMIGFEGCLDSRCDFDAWTRDSFEAGSGGRPQDRRAAGSEASCIAAV